jgi:hypothetical protein
MGRMFGTLWKVLGASSLVLALSGCGGNRIEAWRQATGDDSAALRESSELLGVTVPVLRSQGLERVWGAPKIKLDGQGGYLLTYTDPKHPSARLLIYGMTKPLPKLSTPPSVGGENMQNNTLTGAKRQQQQWRKVTVLEKEVRWFQESESTESDGAYFSTEGFPAKGPDGKKGHFRLVAEYGDSGSDDVARWFASVSF